MLKKVICFLFFFCKFRDEKPEVHTYDNVMFKAYVQVLADEPRCSMYKYKDTNQAA